MHFIYYSHESRFNLFGLINGIKLTSNAQLILYPVAGLEPMTSGSVVSALPYRATQINATKKFNTNVTLKKILICLNLDLIFCNYISANIATRQSGIVRGKMDLTKKIYIIKFIF